MPLLLRYSTYISIALAAVMIAAVALLRPDDKYSVPRRDAAHDKFWIRKAKSTGRYNMVILGDSRTFRSVSPAIMGDELSGITAFNFGFPAGGLNKEVYRYGEQRLKNDGERIIVLGVSPRALVSGSEANAKMRKEIHRPWTALVERVYLYPLIEPFYPFDVFNKLKKEKEALVYTTVGHDNGFLEMGTPLREDTMFHYQAYIDIFATSKVEQRLVTDLLEQTRSWRKQNIKVYGFRPPATRPMHELENEKSGFNEAAFVRAFEEAGGKWIPVTFNQYHSFDGSHIDDTSAVKLSKYLAREIRKDITESLTQGLQ